MDLLCISPFQINPQKKATTEEAQTYANTTQEKEVKYL